MKEQESEELFNVVQFFTNGLSEYVRRNVSAEEAVKALEHYTNNVAVRLGLISKVIITDSWEYTNCVWTPKDGVVYPPQAKRSVAP